MGAPPQSAPSPLLSTFHQFAAHRDGLDVSAEHEKVLVLCHGNAMESPLVQVPRTTAVTVLVVPADVRHTHPAHQPPQRHGGPRPDDKMPMVEHQAISQQIHRITLQPLGQHSLERVVVALLVKQSQATVSAIENVIDHPCFDRPSGSWHSGRFTDGPLTVNVSDVPFSLPPFAGRDFLELCGLVAAWPELPEPIRAGIMAMVSAASGSG